ncbi:unnamed protein product [Adineta ricciae]|uniref:G-protein coupled receptors family 1 profile domain-containing protein n=1 Tax=Adineta ricciae TaxID=249248 RepID=A0A815JCG3_ADIRI|nr:unnamed protein product [Adineta ricciae]CAF1590834.1 unnamed protein product [Adineta ricciae]
MNNTTTVASTGSGVSISLSLAPYELNIYFGMFIWITGNIGCIGNAIVFNSRMFAKQAYARYLFCQAIQDFIYFNFVFMSRVVQKGFRVPLTTKYLAFCRIRQFYTFWGNQISFNSFVFATIDRILATQRSTNLRNWSNRVTLSYKMVAGAMIFWFLLIGHRLIWYQLSDGNCGPPAGIYATWDEWFENATSAVLPPILMFLLAFLLRRSVHDVIQRRIQPTTNQNKTVLEQMSSKLSLMLLLQCIIVVITYVPYSVELAYTSIRQYYSKTPYEKARDKVFTELTHLLAYIFFQSSFYVSLLTNPGFRQQIKHLLGMKKLIDLSTTKHLPTTIHIQTNV